MEEFNHLKTERLVSDFKVKQFLKLAIENI